MPVNWDAVENRLHDASITVLRLFLGDHSEERFYGFIFDVNADYGEVLLCLNTEEALAVWTAEHYPELSPSDVENELRWNAGDWKYQGFNMDPPYDGSWEAAWSDIQEQIHDEYLDREDDEVSERFLESVCRVLVRLERSPAFMQLRREPHFQTLVTDHDEPLEDAWARLAKIRVEADL